MFRSVPLGASVPLTPPLQPAAVYALPDLDTLDAISTGQAPGYIYARDAHPNAGQLEAILADRENADGAVVTGSGMAAISVALLAHTQHGDRIVASDQLYGRTTQLLAHELPRIGVAATFVDTNDLDAVAAALRAAPPAKLLIVESISNPLLRVADIPALVELSKRHQCLLMVDNTFATPELLRPLEFGADLVMESLTKMIAGHSDVTLGVLACQNGEALPRYRQVRSVWGLAGNPFDCWLALRGVATLALRVRAANENATRLAPWLAEQAGVGRVIHPSLPGHPDHDLAQRLLPSGCGNMLTLELNGGRESVNRFIRTATRIPFSPSLGDVFTTCSYPAGTSHRALSPEARQRLGISDGMLRLSVGCEPDAELRSALAEGLAATLAN
jgi:cystathionine beta-lyase/cystathionine gamma-synthase